MTVPIGRHGRRRRLAPLCRVLVVIAAVGVFAGCSSIRKLSDPGNIEYRSATTGPALDVPPDLISPQGNERYTLPTGRNSQSQTLSEYNRNRAAAGDNAPRDNEVMPARAGARIERDGNLRWIVVDQPVEQLWPELRDFWATQGFNLATDSASLGIMETEWAERRQKVETDGVRGILSRVMGTSYATGERDRYRTRVERLPNGGSEIYLTHRGMEEVVTGPLKDASVWQPRPTDPELEIEYLRRIVAALGRTPLQTAAAAAAGADSAEPAPPPERTRVLTDADPSSLAISEGFDRAWREVGLVLDRVGFTVEDRDRSKGTYFVRYVDLDRRDPRQGALSRFFSGVRKDLAGQRYRIVVEGNGAASDATIRVLDENGSAPASEENRRVANRIIALLHEQLK
ncbi:MAG: outer membrane protein assembly factor BamC [Lautropia sp.]